jgi:MoxR-like ATPase
MSLTPQQISVRIKKCGRIHRKVILEFMGVSGRDMPKTNPEMAELMMQMAAADPDSFELYYQVVVNKKMPEASEQLDVGDLQRKVMSAMAEHLYMLESMAEKRAEEKYAQIAKTAAAEVKAEAKAEIENAKKQFITHQVKIGNKKPKPIGGVVPKEFKKLVALAQQRKNILMVGPSGCGKTHIAGVIAEALDMDYAAQSCSAGVSESIFTGWLLPTGDNGKFGYVESEFVRIYENGGVFLLDEFDNTDANLGVFLNMAIAQDHFYLPQRFGNTKVKKHKDFVCVAAANTFGHGADSMYSGRTKLDAATLDRFKVGTVYMTYDEDVERHVVSTKEVLEWGWKLRKIIDKHRLQKVLSTRVMIDASDMIEYQDWTLEEVKQAFFADWAREEKAMVRDDMILEGIL